MFISKARRHGLWLVALLTAAMLVIAGCGSDSDDSSTDTTGSADTTATETTSTDTTSSDDAEAQVIEVGVKSGTLKFDPEELTGKAGKITFRFTNPDAVPHDFVVEQNGKRIDGTDLIANDTADVTIDLAAGDYDFYCTPHKAAGMVGTLKIT